MRKIPTNIENPIDNVIINLSEPFSTMFRHYNFTPNCITTLSLITGVVSVWALYKGMITVAVVFMAFSYFFDCVDGYYARKYDMVTKGGDCYDHIKDVLVFFAYVFILYQRNKSKLTTPQWIIVAGVLVFFLFASVAYFACQEKYYDRASDTPTLGWLQKLVKDKKTAEKCLRVLRYFGMGTFISLLLIFTVWIEIKK